MDPGLKTLNWILSYHLLRHIVRPPVSSFVKEELLRQSFYNEMQKPFGVVLVFGVL